MVKLRDLLTFERINERTVDTINILSYILEN